MAELRDLAGDRPGLALGYGSVQPDADRYRRVADLCLAAGADSEKIDLHGAPRDTISRSR